MIYTSYYAKAKYFHKYKYINVSITNGNPVKDLVPNKFDQIIPDWDLINNHKNGKITDQEYINGYKEQLDKLGINVIKTLLYSFSDIDKDIVLFCYEGNDKFCHRHIFAEWFNEKIGHNCIKEFDFNKDKI